MKKAWDCVKERIAREEQLAEEKRREEQARLDRRNGLIDRFIHEGRSTLLSFARTDRSCFNKEERPAIYYGIIASAVKYGFNLCSMEGINSATDQFLSGMSWQGFTDYRENLMKSWTKILATSETTSPEDAVKVFIRFVDCMSGGADTYQTCMGGSTSCSNQLTNWDGTKKKDDWEAWWKKKRRR